MLRMTGTMKWIVLRRWGPVASFRKKRFQQLLKKMGKAAGPTGVGSEIMKASGGFGSRWMTEQMSGVN